MNQIDNGEEYFKALDWALKNEKVLNIAMSGPYGSGKSSVIRAYLKKHPSIKFINISLASFLEEKEDGDGNVKQTLVDLGNEDKIEEGILKQLFYKVNYKKIPQSRYRKLHNVNGLKIFIKMILLLAVSVGSIAFFSPNTCSKAINIVIETSKLLKINKTFTFVIAVCIILFIIGILSYCFWWLSSKFRVKELNLSDRATVAIKDTNNDSIFNKNMDEIVYFFEATGFDTVFIEDLDRFESAKIFIKLRELNTILNNYEMIKRKIVFIYAIRDDMFINTDRTKFFDAIIPIVPIINSTNSGEILLKRLQKEMDNNSKKIEYKYDIRPQYVTQVSPYIDDMRVLTNIYNEFVIYKNTLGVNQDLNLRDELMMSLIIFKNLYPKDFADLQMEDGIIKKAFDDKKNFITNKIENLNNDKDKIIKNLESIENEVIYNINELKAAMLGAMTDFKGQINYLNVNGKQYRFQDILEDDFELSNLEGGRIEVHYRDNNNGDIPKVLDNVTNIGEFSITKKSYLERCKYLADTLPEHQTEMKEKIREIESQIHKIKSYSLKKLLSMYNDDSILSEKVSENKLLVFLLRNGFIDENYANYMNYFHANSITKADKNFILSVRNREAKDFNYEITKCSQVVDQLIDYEFEQKEIYNFDILEYLLKKRPTGIQCSLFIKQLSDGEDISWLFINEFVDKTEHCDLFLQLLGQSWVGIWNSISSNPILTEERKIFYFKGLLCNTDIAQIEKMNFANDINQYMEGNEEILQQLIDVNVSLIKAVIEKLNVKFSILNCDGIKDELLEYIFSNNYYIVNMPMLQNIFIIKKPEDVNRLQIENYTVLRELQFQPLMEYLDANFIDYIDGIVLKLNTNTNESIESILEIIDKITDDIDRCIALIEKEEFVLPSLRQCSYTKIKQSSESAKSIKKIWLQFFISNKVFISWDNVLTYWQHYGLPGELLRFIEQNMDVLIKSKDSDLVSDDFIKTVIIEQMELAEYRKFISKFNITEFTNEISEFTKEQINIMLECSYFEITPELLNQMRDNYPELCYDFIIKNKDIFLNNIEKYNVIDLEVDKLVENNDMDESEKLIIISAQDINVMTEKIATCIRNMTIKVDKDLVEKSWNILSADNRYELLINHIKVYDLDELENKFKELGNVYIQLTDRSKKHKVTLVESEFNQKLMNYLNSVGYLSSITQEVHDMEDIITHRTNHISNIVGWVKKA